jgi:hypothetical protein
MFVRYKPEGRGCESDCVIVIFHWHNPSVRAVAIGSAQCLTETNTSNVSRG